MTYEEHHKSLITYLQAKVAIADWHGVSDAANDLRVLEASAGKIAIEARPHRPGGAAIESVEKRGRS